MAAYQVAGKGFSRIDSDDKAAGHARFGADMPSAYALPGLVLGSPYASAKVLSVDAGRARRIPGVRFVLTRDECPDIRFGAVIKDQRWLAKDGFVRFVGDPVAAVAAETIDAAREALEAIEVRYEEREPVLDAIKSRNGDGPLVHEDWEEIGLGPGGGQNVIASFERIIGDIETGFREADRVYEHTFQTGFLHPAYIEPHACLAESGADGKVTIWTCTQAIFEARDEVSEALGLPNTKVRIIPTEIGGGFGGKTRPVLEHIAALLAIRSGQAVRLEMSREADHAGGGFRHPHTIVIRTGVKNDGTLVARDVDVTMDQGAYGRKAPGQCSSKMEMASAMYRIPNVRVRACTVYTNGPMTGPVRAPSGPQYHFATEVQMDIIARDLGMDPVELRRLNGLRTGDRSLAGEHRDGAMMAILDRTVAEGGWGTPVPLPEELKADGWKAGRGLACGFFHGSGGAASCTIRLNGDGSFHVVGGTVNLSGASTSLSQLAAEELGVGLDSVRFDCGDSDTAPESIRATGSMTTRSLGAAVLKAARDAREKIFSVAATKLEASSEDLGVVDGQVFVRSAPDRSISLAEVAALAPQVHGFLLGQGASPAPPPCPVYTGQVAEVAVHPESGEIRVLRITCVQDVGFAINPLSVVGQMEGGMLQGLGLALMEEQPRKTDGSLHGESLHEFLIPTSQDLPDLNAVVVEYPADGTPYGVRGVGEPPIVATAAAIVNAIQNAIGAPFFSLPVAPHHILKAMQNGAGNGTVSA